MKEGKQSVLSNLFTYDPSLHCFQKETDEVIQQLIQVVHDEKLYMEGLTNQSESMINHTSITHSTIILGTATSFTYKISIRAACI